MSEVVAVDLLEITNTSSTFIDRIRAKAEASADQLASDDSGRRTFKDTLCESYQDNVRTIAEHGKSNLCFA